MNKNIGSANGELKEFVTYENNYENNYLHLFVTQQLPMDCSSYFSFSIVFAPSVIAYRPYNSRIVMHGLNHGRMKFIIVELVIVVAVEVEQR